MFENKFVLRFPFKQTNKQKKYCLSKLVNAFLTINFLDQEFHLIARTLPNTITQSCNVGVKQDVFMRGLDFKIRYR